MTSHLDEECCDEEEEYQLIFEEYEGEEALDPDQDYDIPMTPHTSPKVRLRNTSPEVRLRNTSPSGFSNLNKNNSGNNS